MGAREGYAEKATPEEVAAWTVMLFRNCVPVAVPGIAFLSGGQSDLDATANLDAIARLGPHPWGITFSYGRALQHAAQHAWAGKSEREAAGQSAFAHRADERAGAAGAMVGSDGEGDGVRAFHPPLPKAGEERAPGG